MIVAFEVLGVPVPKGSAKAFKHYRSNKIITRQSNADSLYAWQEKIGWAARTNGVTIVTGAVRLDCLFTFKRPKSHFGTGKNADKMKNSAPQKHVQDPDRDKLLRAVQDALEGVGYLDDNQITEGETKKEWGTENKVFIVVRSL